MKNLLTLICILLVSCSENIIDKPDNLIPESKMVDIMFDIAVLDAARSSGAATLEEHNIVSDHYIYTKFDIDSVQYAESSIYYTSKPVQQQRIFEEVRKRLEAYKQKLEKQDQLERENKTDRSDPSIKKISRDTLKDSTQN